ncbi:hypothetical protein P691DRAFT_438365 [Macrolepiota fuliginosa MF-IS2]|uniref:Uncharacterized protein n=1 Tax=Macrolepiota fuliginosa MF-IS2 TaxID=1400762 RepID=A0A9P6BYT7_9AGAR|nr:hypothetical protein P691DRAFT_438365 [Macrolepiota fuliginosa MF-IS2]
MDTQVLVIHGQLDQIPPLSCRMGHHETEWTRVIEEGSQPVKVPTLIFVHLWYEMSYISSCNSRQTL